MLGKVSEANSFKQEHLEEENEQLLKELEALKKKYNELKAQMEKSEQESRGPQAQPLKLTDDFFLKTESVPKNIPSLFLSVAYLMNEIPYQSLFDTSLAKNTILYVKKYASATMIKHRDTFSSDELKGKSPEEYTKIIEEDTHFGNSIDLKALSHHYRVSITIIRIKGKEAKAESINEKEYKNAIFLLNDSVKSPNYYEPILGNNQNDEEFKTFDRNVYEEIKKRAINLAQELLSI